MKSTFRIVALTQEEVHNVRTTQKDQYGNKVIEQILALAEFL